MFIRSRISSISAICEISNVTTNKYEFTLVYIQSGSRVLIRPVCLIPFGRHILGTELSWNMSLVQKIVQYCQ